MRKEDGPLAKEVISLLLDSAKIQTLGEIYGRIKPDNDRVIRTVCSPVGTETGRFSHSETFLEPSTNLGNLPKKVAALDPLYNVRECLVPRDGYVLMEWDLSQAEARATSAYAQDYDTLGVFESGTDIHSWTAGVIFDVPAEEVTKQQRHLGKMARHALNYGMGWNLFLAQVNKDADLTGVAITAATAKDIVDEYRSKNKRLVEWWSELEDEVYKNGYLETCFGRRRHFLSPQPRRTDIAAYLPQSTIADLLNRGLVRVFDELDTKKVGGPRGPRLLMQLHDAIIMEVPDDYMMSIGQLVKEKLTIPMQINGYELIVPVDVSYSFDSWGAMEDLDLPDLAGSTDQPH